MNFGGFLVGFPVGYMWMAVDSRTRRLDKMQTYVCILALGNYLDR